MKLTKRNKVRLIIAMAISSILFAVAYIPALVALLLMMGMAAGVVEMVRFLLEDLMGYDFSDE
jgi:membrane protease YdiL (CAAX protease family)